MGRLTPGMIENIRAEFRKCHSYTKTAKSLGSDERTVKRHVSEPDNNLPRTNNGGNSRTGSITGTCNTEWNQTIYRELRKGMKPEQIIEKHGFPSNYVQAEYELFNRNRNTDMVEFQKRYINDFEAYVENETPDLQPYLDTFRERGYLTNNELLELFTGVSSAKD